MKKRNFVTYISIPLLIGLLSSVLLWRSLTYFNDELSPPLSPPIWILIIVWNILFILIGYASWTFRKNHISMILYGCLLFMTLCWLILFYLLHFYVIGAVWMLLTITLSFVLIKRNIKSYKYALIGLLPYLIWCFFSLYICASTILLNGTEFARIHSFDNPRAYFDAFRNASLYRTELDDGLWSDERLVPATGYTGKSDNSNITRIGHIQDNIRKMIAPSECLWVFVYDVQNGQYMGVWDETNAALVKDDSAPLLKEINFEELRRQYPSMLFKVNCHSSTIDVNTSYPANNIEVEYYSDKPNSSVTTKLQYEEIPLNPGDWRQYRLDHSTGKPVVSNKSQSTTYYVPEYWKEVKANEIMEVHVYDENDTFVGMFNPKTGLWLDNAFSSLCYIYDIDFDYLRFLFPDYKFRIHLRTNIEDISSLGTVLIDKDLYHSYMGDSYLYRVYNRFTRTCLYEEDFDTATRVVTQGMCTDGNYFYFSTMKSAGVDGDGTFTYLRKVDLDGNLILETEIDSIGHANSLAYDPNTKTIYAVGTYNKDATQIRIIDPNTLALLNTVDFSTLLSKLNKQEGTNCSGFNSIAYLEKDNAFILGSGSILAIVDPSFSNINKVIKVETHKRMLRQFIYPTEDYIISAYAQSDYDIYIYDWNGNTLAKFDVGLTAGTGYNELESLCIIDGLYYTSWNCTGNIVRIVEGNPIGYITVPSPT